jgi:hypothetical protein
LSTIAFYCNIHSCIAAENRSERLVNTKAELLSLNWTDLHCIVSLFVCLCLFDCSTTQQTVAAVAAASVSVGVVDNQRDVLQPTEIIGKRCHHRSAVALTAAADDDRAVG